MKKDRKWEMFDVERELREDIKPSAEKKCRDSRNEKLHSNR